MRKSRFVTGGPVSGGGVCRDDKGREYDAFAPAYRAGYEGRAKYHGRSFDEVETDLENDYKRHNGKLDWIDVKDATRNAWNRVDTRVRDAAR